MTITKCDRCNKEGKWETVNRWVEIRYAEGGLASFIFSKSNTIELCYECWNEFMRYTSK